jgi:phenylacetate-CoA ligase
MSNNVPIDITASTALVSLQSRPDIRDLIDFAQTYSPYYKAFYSNVAKDVSFLQDYPVVYLDSFWKANTCKKSQVITTPHSGGIIWNTGGKKNSSRKNYT